MRRNWWPPQDSSPKVSAVDKLQHFMGRSGRKIFCKDNIALARVKFRGRTTAEFAQWIANQSVQDQHLRRRDHHVTLFRAWLGEKRRRIYDEAVEGSPAAIAALATYLAEYGAHLIRSRPRIGRSTTISKYLIMASDQVPGLWKKQAVTRFMAGIQHLSPILPDIDQNMKQVDLEKLRKLVNKLLCSDPFFG